MNLKQLEAFVQVAEGKSFSKAAKDLFLTQPTISAHIATLEKELNVRVFVRNTKEVYLSEEGKRLYENAKKMIDLEKEIESMFCVRTKKARQCITIAASTIPAQYLLPQILATFSERYPDVQFKITETDSAKVVEQIANNTVDIGFTGTVLEKKNCKYIPFYQDELVVITPNQEKFQRQIHSHKDLKWIMEESIIMREEGSGTRKEAQKQLESRGVEIQKLHIVASLENQETIKKLVQEGMGISMMSKLATANEVAMGTLLSIPISLERRNLNIIYNCNFQLSSSTDKFIRIVKEMYLEEFRAKKEIL